MSKYFADFRQRCTVAQHLGCQGVAKLMSARRRGLNAGAPERMTND
jgi:hypothetical protein